MGWLFNAFRSWLDRNEFERRQTHIKVVYFDVAQVITAMLASPTIDKAALKDGSAEMLQGVMHTNDRLCKFLAERSGRAHGSLTTKEKTHE